MIEELEHAGIAFRAALDRYLSVCSKIGEPSLLRDIPQRHLDAIDLEVAHFSSYKSKLRQIEATISRIRNCLPKVVSIASLPPETLTHIFHLVVKPCDLIAPNHEDELKLDSDTDLGSDSDSANEDTKRRHKNAWGLDNYPAHMDNVTRVCSHWRKIAIACPSLWTHIDIISHVLLYTKLLARAKTYVARAAQLPLELHFADAIPFSYDEASLGQFLSSVFNRVQSLNIAVVHGWRWFHNFIFTELFLRESQPNIFTKLTTSFTMANDNIDEFVAWPSRANHLQFTTLHLRGLFPMWHSRAYLNLVDLRLTASRDERWIEIQESELRSILVANPRLRIFHFALGIKDWQPEDDSVFPVRLDDLEILSIRTERDECSTVTKLGHVLRLIAPGLKPLQLSIWHNFLVYDPTDDDMHQDDFSPEELTRFFERSNLKKFCFNNESFQPDQLLRNATHLEDLVLETYILPPCSDGPISRINPITPRLKSLTLQNCYLSLDRLEVLLRQYPADRLVLSRCNWTFDSHPQGWDQVREVSELLERYPATKAIFESSDASASWDLID